MTPTEESRERGAPGRRDEPADVSGAEPADVGAEEPVDAGGAPAGADPIDPQVAREEQAAAAEAAAIGGMTGVEALDPAERPVLEGGGGVAEGFEQAEEALIEHAQHESDARDPLADAGRPEPESDRVPAEYGEADQVESTEVVRDPEEGPEDPGAGPGLTAER